MQHEVIDKIKDTSVERALDLSKNAGNRFVHALSETVTFAEDLLTRSKLELTIAVTEFRESFSQKMRDVPQELYETSAMTDSGGNGATRVRYVEPFQIRQNRPRSGISVTLAAIGRH